MYITANPLTVEQYRQFKLQGAEEVRAEEVKHRRELVRVLGWVGTPRAKECLLRLTRSDVKEIKVAAEAALDDSPVEK